MLPTQAATQPPRGPGGWLLQTNTMVVFLSLSGSDAALTGTFAGGDVPTFRHMVQPFSGSVYGSADKDGILSLTFDPPPGFAARGQITGRITGSTLELTYPDSSAKLVTLSFSRADAAAYNTALEALRQSEAAAAAAEAEAEASAAASGQAAAELETCSRRISGHDAKVYFYRRGGDAAQACKDIKRFSIGDGFWELPVQPSEGGVSGSLVCSGQLDGTLVYVYDSGGQRYGGLICDQLPKLPYIGINWDPAPSGVGIRVALDGVVSGSPADKAGLRDRDIIVSIDRYPVNSGMDLDVVESQHAPGDVITLSIERGGKSIDIQVTLGRRP